MEYLRGGLTARQEEELKQLLREEGYDLSHLAEMEKLYHNLDDLQIPEPRQEMHDKFYRLLEDEKARIEGNKAILDSLVKPFRAIFEPAFLPRLAYAAVLLIIGMLLGHWIIPDKQLRSQTSLMMAEMQNMKKMMALALFEQSNASDRLKAVSFTSELNQPDDKVLSALLKTLNNDPNVNVRLASLDALAEQVERADVRSGLVQSITKQDSPLIQIAIAELMIRIEEKSSVPEFRKLLEREELDELVAEKINESIKTLT